MGLQFLRHIERTRTLAFLIPLDAEDPQAEYEQLRREVENFAEDLAATPHCVVITKADLAPPGGSPPTLDVTAAWGTFRISSVSREGLEPLLEGLFAQTRLEMQKQAEEGEEEEWWVPE